MKISKTLEIGDSGDEVCTLHRFLKKFNFLNLDSDCKFGTLTENAVSEYQNTRGLTITGKVDESTVESMHREFLQQSKRPRGLRIFTILYSVGLVVNLLFLVPPFSFLLLSGFTSIHPLSEIVGMNPIGVIIMIFHFVTLVTIAVILYALRGRNPTSRKIIMITGVIGAIVTGFSFYNIVGLLVNAAVVYCMILPSIRDYYGVK